MNSKDSKKSSQKRKNFINSRKVHEIKKEEKRPKKQTSCNLAQQNDRY